MKVCKVKANQDDGASYLKLPFEKRYVECGLEEKEALKLSVGSKYADTLPEGVLAMLCTGRGGLTQEPCIITLESIGLINCVF